MSSFEYLIAIPKGASKTKQYPQKYLDIFYVNYKQYLPYSLCFMGNWMYALDNMKSF